MAVIGASNSLGGLAGSNAVARLLVVISGDATPLSAAIAKADGTLAGFGKNATTIGNTLTRNLSLPLLALGGYAVKASTDFSTAVGRVAGLTPFLKDAQTDIQGVSDTLLNLASDPRIIAGPTDLANSLYIAGSAGLKASQALEVVKFSAQAMSVGMGDASDISRVLIAALNNYGPSGLTATHAMDVMTAAIQEGSAAPDELAIALGRVLPVAKQAGISFDQVAASVAQLTNLGVPTRVATTSLRALFSELLVPTIKATKTLDQFGISVKQLNQTMATGGPVAAFNLLFNAVGRNENAIHDIIPQIRGFTAFLGLTGDNAKSFSSILNEVTNSAGKFDRALTIISKTPAFQFQKGIQQLQIAAITLGNELIPVFLKLADVLQDLGRIFTELPGPIHSFFAALLVAGVVVGPILKLYGALTQVKEATVAFSGGATTMLPTVGALAKGFVTMGLGAVLAAGAFSDLAGGSASLVTIATGLIGTFLAVKLAITGLSVAAQAGILGAGGLSEALVGLGGYAAPIAISLAVLGTTIFYLVGRTSRAHEVFHEMGESMKGAAEQGQTLNQALNAIKDDDLREHLRELANEVRGLGSELAVTAIPKEAALVGDDLVRTLESIVSIGSFAGSAYSDQAGKLSKYIPIIESAVASGTDLGQAFKDAGLSSEEFYALLTDAGNRASLGSLGENAARSAEELGTLQAVMRSIQIDTRNTIAAHSLEAGSVEQLAIQYGVSTDTISKALNDYGVTATGVLDGNVIDFGKAAGFIDQDTGKMIGKFKELQAATAEIASDLSGALSGSFNLFGDLPKQLGDFDKIIEKAQELSAVAVQQGANVRTLLERGVPSGLIEQFISEGPQMVAAFAGATKPALDKVVNAYELALGAMDESILQEAAHQEGKGKNMVANFATAILSADNLLRGAGGEIVAIVGEGLSKGTVKPQALGLIQTFVGALNSANGVSRGAGTKAAIAFADGIATGDFVSPKGKLLVAQAARGIAAASGLTFAAAKALVQRVADGIDTGGGRVRAAARAIANEAAHGFSNVNTKPLGAKLTLDFAAGIHDPGALGMVEAAALRVAGAARAAFQAGLENSPYFFTLPMGRKLVTDLYLGADEQSKKSNADEVARNTIQKFNQAFLHNVPRLNESLSKLLSLVKDNMKKAFDAGDVEAVKSLEKLGKHLEDHLNKLHDRFMDFRKSIRGGFSEFGDFGSIITDQWQEYQDALAQYQEDLKKFQEDQANFTGEGTAPVAPTAPTAPDFSAIIRKQVDDAKRLARDLTEAASKGLNQVLLAQFASQGAAGADALEELLKNPQLISELNDASEQIHSVVGNIVGSLGEHYFGKAIAFATDALLRFSTSIITLVKELVSGLGSKNKELIQQLNDLLKALRQQGTGPLGTGGPAGNGNGPNPNANASGPGTSPWDTGWYQWHVPQNSPVNQNAVMGSSAASTTIYTGDIIVQGSYKPEETAKAVRRELNRVADRNGGRTGLRSG